MDSELCNFLAHHHGNRFEQRAWRPLQEGVGESRGLRGYENMNLQMSIDLVTAFLNCLPLAPVHRIFPILCSYAGGPIQVGTSNRMRTRNISTRVTA